jgi:hypothetical protein
MLRDGSVSTLAACAIIWVRVQYRRGAGLGARRWRRGRVGGARGRSSSGLFGTVQVIDRRPYHCR